MLKIEEYDNKNNYRTLSHSNDVFHKALRAVLNGEKRFHVTGAEEKYDLVYYENNELYFENSDPSQNSLFAGETVIPPYFIYNENDTSKLYFDLLDVYENIVFEEVNEYTVVMARLLLNVSDKQIYFVDERAKLFFETSSRLHIGEPEDEDAYEMRVCETKVTVTYLNKHEKIRSYVLFHNIFLMQWIFGDLSVDKVKYAEVFVKKTEGIGGFLQFCVRCSTLFSKYGIKTYFKSGSSRFRDELIDKYFSVQKTPEDSNDQNTVYVVNYMATALTHRFLFAKANVTYDILSPSFKNELEEYTNAIIGNKKMLGVLIRGTDYNMMMSSDAKTPFLPVSAERMIPEIQKCLDKYDYEGIFLATEDKDALKTIREAFPGKVKAISQERRSITEFSKGQTISDIERRIYSPEEYTERVEDTTINYFYALYVLSKCSGFLASSMCTGVHTVRSFNGGKFECDVVVRELILKGELV